jgi:hypothetical protein
MSIISLTNYRSNDQDHIATLWRLMRMVREIGDAPELWKLSDPWLEAIERYMHVDARTQLFSITFLDTRIDATSNDPSLICVRATYPIMLVQAS